VLFISPLQHHKTLRWLKWISACIHGQSYGNGNKCWQMCSANPIIQYWYALSSHNIAIKSSHIQMISNRLTKALKMKPLHAPYTRRTAYWTLGPSHGIYCPIAADVYKLAKVQRRTAWDEFYLKATLSYLSHCGLSTFISTVFILQSNFGTIIDQCHWTDRL